jgi:hypothetical protein
METKYTSSTELSVRNFTFKTFFQVPFIVGNRVPN